MLVEKMSRQINDSKLYRLGALALFMMPLCYVGMFVIFGALLEIPQTSNLSERIEYVVSEQGLIGFAYIVGYLIFGVLLLVAVQSLHKRLSGVSTHLLNSASLFGLTWVVLMMCAGMTALVGMNTMTVLYPKDPQASETLFYVYTTVVNALGGGIELVGGLWVLLISVVSLRSCVLPKGLGILGLIVGAFGILTIFRSIPMTNEVFGLSQIIWFFGVGAVLCRTQDTQHA